MNRPVINKEDFENYKIPIPIKSLFPVYKKRFIYGELEKYHPCFSDDFYFFPKNKLSKKGVIADTIVIYKTKLSEYQNKTGANCFEFENIKNRKIKLREILFMKPLIISLFSLIIIISVFLYEAKIRSRNIETSEIDYNFDNSIIKDFSYFDKNILSKLLEVIKINNGKLNELTWTIAIGGENISCNVENIYPEIIQKIIPNVSISDVVYEKGLPIFDFNISNKFNLESSDNDDFSVDTKNEIRNLLKSYKTNIIKEGNSPFEILFETDFNFFPGENLFIVLNTLLVKNGVYIKSLSISSKEDCKLNISLKFTGNKLFKNNLLEIIGANVDLLLPNTGNYYMKNENKENKEKIIKNSIDEIKNKYDIIGEMKYKNGKKIIFYKNNEGKIEKKEFDYEV